jgi:hypothetical protein
MVCAPQLRGNKHILPLHAGIEGLFQALSNLVFIAIAVCAINVFVSVLQRIGDGFLDFARSGLPSSCCRSQSTAVSTDILTDSPRPRAGIEAPVFRGKRVSETLNEPMID